MNNRLYKDLLHNNLFYEEQFRFQASNQTEDAVIQLSKTLEAFKVHTRCCKYPDLVCTQVEIISVPKYLVHIFLEK